jgi:hypothetical protein
MICVQKKVRILRGNPFIIISNERNDRKQWKTFTLGSILSDIRYGTAKKSFYEVNDGTPVLRIPNIGDGYISSADLKFGEFNKKEIETELSRWGKLNIKWI